MSTVPTWQGDRDRAGRNPGPPPRAGGPAVVARCAVGDAKEAGQNCNRRDWPAINRQRCVRRSLQHAAPVGPSLLLPAG